MKRKSNGHTDIYLKRQAKKIKRQEQIPYLQALDKASKEAGFSSYRHFVNQSKVNTIGTEANTKKLKLNKREGIDLSESVKFNPYRNLLVAGINELIRQKNILQVTKDMADGYLMVNLFGFPSVVLWQDIGFEELRISVWWKYDHAKHPHANLKGSAIENFKGSSPLSKRHNYKKFVGVILSGWLERNEGKYLQGTNNKSIFDRYIRRGENRELLMLPLQKPNGFEIDGKFQF
jgi:hypothetical protein